MTEMSYNKQVYDSAEEAAIDWYQHYMAIQERHLEDEYLDQEDPSPSIEKAVEQRLPHLIGE